MDPQNFIELQNLRYSIKHGSSISFFIPQLNLFVAFDEKSGSC